VKTLFLWILVCFLKIDKGGFFISTTVGVPLLCSLLVFLLFLGKDSIRGFLLIIILQFSKGFKLLRVFDVLFFWKYYKDLLKFWTWSIGRAVSVSIYFVNFVFFFIFIFWYESWFYDIGVCTKYVIFFDTFGFYFMYTLILTVLLVSAMFVTFSFALAFFYSTGSHDSMMINKIGIFDRRSKFYYSKCNLNDPISFISLMVIGILNLISSSVGGFMWFLFYSDSKCQLAHVQTFSILLLITFIFGFVAISWNVFSLLLDCLSCCKFKIKRNRESQKLVMEDIKTILTKKPAKFWDKEQCMYWLKIHGFEKYSKELSIFTMNTLKEHMTLSDIRQLGITNEYHQKSLLELISNMQPLLPLRICIDLFL
jgi:hypothetical protein